MQGIMLGMMVFVMMFPVCISLMSTRFARTTTSVQLLHNIPRLHASMQPSTFSLPVVVDHRTRKQQLHDSLVREKQ